MIYMINAVEFQETNVSFSLNANLKVGSHDPIFASNYSLAHFVRQQLDVWMPIFDKFSAVFVYWMKIEDVPTFSHARPC